MSKKDFYSSPSYRAKQSQKTKLNWLAGRMDFLRRSESRHCTRPDCKDIFTVIPSDPKRYCSQTCAAQVNNIGRTPTLATRDKIRRANTGRKYPNRLKAPPRYSVCLQCKTKFVLRYWRPVTNPIKYCSRICAIKDIGGRQTSPCAARAKAGIRPDIDPHIYFYSRWEANFARLMNLLHIAWIHQPATFQLVSQKYTPDFYLPEIDTYIEIKNFLSNYSRQRDEQFRKKYPNLKLILILKEDYLALQRKYASHIVEWEYSSRAPSNS